MNTISASIIIDDPLLRENYGYLNYHKLLAIMDRHNFCATIAFIPFNYKRTDAKIADLFRSRIDRFSLCVHGCDHTKGEFAITDVNYLTNKVILATARMLEHERRTKIPFEKIMVFPQGKFTNEALEVLKENGYLAAVNTDPMPVHGSLSSNLPFFLRYKPETIMSMKDLPNPLFVVIHHDYFKEGYNKLADFVDWLNTTYTIKWDSVGNIVKHYVKASEVSRNSLEVDLSGLKIHGYKENTKILMRRYASEFRDNYICKSDFLNRLIKAKPGT